MKIAVVTHYFPTSADPWAGHSAYQTLRVLAATCDVHVFYPEPVRPGILTPAARRTAPLDRTWSPAGVKVSYIPYPVLPVLSRPLNGFTIANRLLPHVRRFAPDIILNYVVYPNGFAAVRIGRALHVPVVLTAIGSDLNRIADPLCRVLTRSALRHADAVTTVSRDLARTALTLGAVPARTSAILNGCDTAIFHPQDRLDARTALNLDPTAEIIVYVGRLDLRKGLVELIESVAALHSTRPRLRCFILGDGAAKPTLLRAIDQHNAAAIISLVPSQFTDKVALWMAAANLVTLPSYNEGCPNVIIEALSAGRPVVATHVGGIPELMDESCGRLIPPRDVPALTRALAEVLDQSWSAEAIASKHSRGWTDVAADLRSVLESTLSQRKNS